MAKERELEERRKNEPPLDLSESHPVRKIISRFRKMSLSRPSFFDSYHMDPAKSFRDDQLLTTTNSGKGLFSRLKKAAYLRRTSTFAESQFLLESPSLIGSPSLSVSPNFTEIESLGETPDSIKTLLDGKSLFRSSIELNSNESCLKLPQTLEQPYHEVCDKDETDWQSSVGEKPYDSSQKRKWKTKLTVPNEFCDDDDAVSLLDEINNVLLTKHYSSLVSLC